MTVEPDAAAAARILTVAPQLRGLALARDAVGLRSHELLHAGPPIGDPAGACAPIMHSAITAIRFEGWADTVDAAAALLRSGAIRLRPAQDCGCVVPLADVVSPSMWLQEVADAGATTTAWSPINGGAEHVLRVGVLDDDVLAHLRWINGSFARAFRGALGEPIALIPLADAGLAGGDDCHGRTAVATAELATRLERRWTGVDAQRCRDFMSRAPSFFLNVWMAASKSMLDAARNIAESSVIVAAGGNGKAFGIQIAAAPGTWFTAPADPPAVAPGGLPANATPLGAIGDSAIVDCLGLGAMTAPTSATAAPPPFADLFPDAVDAPTRLLTTEHPGFSRMRPLVIASAARAADSAQVPIVSLGVLDSAGELGRLAGGFYRPPLDLFRRAAASVPRVRAPG
jgi:hypothetical protein